MVWLTQAQRRMVDSLCLGLLSTYIRMPTKKRPEGMRLLVEHLLFHVPAFMIVAGT